MIDQGKWKIYDADLNEKGYVTEDMAFEFDLGGEYNDVELECLPGFIEFGDWIVCIGTEYAACLQEKVIENGSATEIWRGNTIQKIVNQNVILSEKFNGTYTCSNIFQGTLKETVQSLISLNGDYGNYCLLADEEPEDNRSHYWVFEEKQAYMFDTVTGYLKNYGYRPRFEVTTEDGLTIKIELRIDKIRDVSTLFEYSEDTAQYFTISQSQRGINHLVVVGKLESEYDDSETGNRPRVDLYLHSDGSISTTDQEYTGIYDRQDFYEAEAYAPDTCEEAGREYFATIIEGTTLTVNLEDMTDDYDLYVGDVIAARSFEHSAYATATISQKILNYDHGKIKIEYQTEEPDEEGDD